MEKQGVIYLKIACYLEHDVTPDEAQEIVDGLNYSVTHDLISDTNIQEWD